MLPLKASKSNRHIRNRYKGQTNIPLSSFVQNITLHYAHYAELLEYRSLAEPRQQDASLATMKKPRPARIVFKVTDSHQTIPACQGQGTLSRLLCVSLCQSLVSLSPRPSCQYAPRYLVYRQIDSWYIPIRT